MAGGKITLSLNMGATRANIRSQLDKIINDLKPKVTLDVQIKNKSEIQQMIKDVERLNAATNKAISGRSGAKNPVAQLASNWGSSINTYKKAEAALARIKKEASSLGVTLKKADLNAFSKAMSGRDLNGAVQALARMKSELVSVRSAAKAAYADFKTVDNAKAMLAQVSSVKNASSELMKQQATLQRTLSTFLNPNNSDKVRLSAYQSIPKQMERISSSLKVANAEAKKFSSIDKTMTKLGDTAAKLGTLRTNLQEMASFGGFKADTSSIDSLIERYNKLQSIVSKLKSGQSVKGWNLQSAIAEAEKLRVAMDAALRGNGRDSASPRIRNFSAEVRKLQADIERIGTQWSALFNNPKLASQYHNLTKMARNVANVDQLRYAQKEVLAFSSEVRAAGANVLTLGDHFKRTFRNFSMYFGASRIIYEGVAAIRAMISNVAQLDSAMVELRKVSDATDAEYDAYFKRSKQSAVEVGTTVHELINATSDFARLGYELGDAENLAKVATIYHRVGDDVNSVDDATQSIISTMKAFGIQADDAISIVDKFNEVGNNFAISSGGIGDALQRSASAFKASGSTIDESIALIVAANNVVQDPEVVGTMWKTVTMRLRGAKTELEEAGLETEGMAESTSKLREQVKALTNVTGEGGFDIMLDENTFKSPYEMMLGIGKVWKEMSDIDQAALLELLAGKRQGNALAAVLTNLDDMQKALEVSENSAGSASREHEIWLESIDAKTQQFKASFESLSATVFNTDFLKGMVDMGTGFIQTIDGFFQGIQEVNGLVPTIKAASLALAAPVAAGSIGDFFLMAGKDEKNRLQRWGESAVATGRKIKNIFTDGALGGVYKGAGKNGGDLIFRPEGFMKLASSVNLYTAGITAAVAALVALYGITKKIEADRKQRRVDAETDAKRLQEREESLGQLRQRYIELSRELSSGDLSAEETLSKRMEIADIQKQISELVGDEAGKLDLVNGKLSEQLAILDDIQAAQFGKWKSDNAEALDRAKLEYSEGFEKVYDVSASKEVRSNRNDAEYLNTYNAFVDRVRKTLGDDIANQFAGNAFSEWSLNLTDMNAEDALQTTQTLVDLLEDFANDTNMSEAMRHKFDGLREGLNGAEDSTQALVDRNKLLIETYATGELQTNRKYQKMWSELLATQDAYNEAVEKGDVEAQKNAIDRGREIRKGFEEGIKTGQYDDSAVNAFVEDYMDDWESEFSGQEIEIDARVKVKQNAESLKQMMGDVQKVFNNNGSFDLTQIIEMDFQARNSGSLSNFSTEQVEAFKQIATAANEAGVSVGEFMKILAEEGVINLDDSQMTYLNSWIEKIATDAEALGNLEVALNMDLNGDDVIGQVKEDIEEIEGDHEVNIDVNGDEAKEATKNYVEMLKEAKEAGVDLSKKRFGNIDTDNRQRLEWNEQNLNKYRKVLQDDWKQNVNDLRGSYSTVMGSWGNFGQAEIPIAFSPMLQTKSGQPKLLDANTVYGYIDGLIDEVTAGGTKPLDAGELLKLDAKGLEGFEVEGERIKGLIADIGETAGETSEQMHFAGATGSLADAYNEVKKYADAAGMSVEEFVSHMHDIPEEKISELELEVKGEKQLEKAKGELEDTEGKHKASVDVKTSGEPAVAKLGKSIGGIVSKKVTEAASTTGQASVNKLGSAIGRIISKSVKETATVSGTEKVNALGNAIGRIVSKTVDIVANVYEKYVKPKGSWTGTTHATEGLTLVGERGEELVQSKGKAYFVGTKHPEIVWLKQGDIVYNAEETKQIKNGSKVIRPNTMNAFADGTNNSGRLTSSYTAQRTRESFNFLPANGEKGDNFKLEEQLKDALEQIDKKVKESLNNYEHQILIMEKNHVNSSEMIKVYRDMQAEVTRIANEYRAKGLNDNSDYIQDLQKQWWDYADKIKELTAQQYEEARKLSENAIDLNTNWLANAVDNKDYEKVLQYTQNIVQNYKYMQEQIHEQAQYYRSLGYTDTSDEVAELSKLWYEYRDKILEATSQAYAGMVESADEAVDNMQSLYSTLVTAGEEYAESGHITIDTFQDLVGLGTKYLAHLIDENGQLVINEESIKRVLAAKTKELAINEALNYVAQIRAAVESGNIEQINALCDATNDLTNASWDLVYIQLQQLGLSGEQYESARQNINRLRSLSENAVNGIDHELQSMKGDVGDILEYVKEMVQQEVENHIEALEEQIEDYQEIVDLQKESLRLQKEKDEYTKNVAKQTKDIAELQARIAQLDLDTSREAQAQKLKLQEELAEKQEKLA